MWCVSFAWSSGETTPEDMKSRTFGRSGPPQLAFSVFRNQAEGEALDKALEAVFPGIVRIGTLSQAAIHCDPFCEDKACVTLIGFERSAVSAVSEPLGGVSDFVSGQRLGEALAADDLKHVFVFFTRSDVDAEALISGIGAATGPGVTLSGGMAGVDLRSQESLISFEGTVSARMAVAVGLYGAQLRIGTGTGGGWRPFGPIRQVTASDGCRLMSVDGEPAIDLYKRYLGDEAPELENVGIFYPLAIYGDEGDGDYVVRTFLDLDPDQRSVQFAGRVPIGARVRLMRGAFDPLMGGAESAGVQALNALRQTEQDLNAEACLVVSCIGRRVVLGQRAPDEIEAVSGALSPALAPGVSPFGFYSYGEVAPLSAEGGSRFHNQTLVVTLMAEVA